MDQSIAIRAEHVKKLFYIANSRSDYTTLRELIQSVLRVRTSKKRHRSLWALDDVSFTVNKKDRFAVIGLNGSGKSTLLKILSRVLYPTAGAVTINGRVTSLLELGTGFHPDLSGRDNIYLNGSILGMTRKAIRAVYNDILEFSEIKKFIDTPIKFYSSGMQARLGFAVAAHLQSEILIIDEVLSVGDQRFQEKCLRRMREICKSGKTILFVSHNLDAVKGLCNRGILLSNGKIKNMGDIESVTDVYTNMHREQKRDGLLWTGNAGNDDLRVKRLEVKNRSADTKIQIQTPLTLSIDYEIFATIHDDLCIGVNIVNARNHAIASSRYSISQSRHASHCAPGGHRIELTFDFSLFTGGVYSVELFAMTAKHGYVFQHSPSVQLFVDDNADLVSDRRHAMPDGVVHPADWQWRLDTP